jgi:predicted nuclease of predicted toxin-antitoxin system
VIRFVIDAHVKNALRQFLVDSGHEVHSVRDELMPGALDPEIAAFAHQLGAVIITWNRKHFRPLISREHARRTTDFANAGLISCQCRPDDAVSLFAEHLPVIEFQYQRRQAMDDKRLIVELDQTKITFL